MRTPKILFISKKRNDSYGVSYGLVNSAGFIANFFDGISDIECRFVNVVDGNGIDRVVTGYNPTHVVIEALWVTPQKMDQLLDLHRHRHRLWTVRIHSKIPFLANEGIACSWLWGYREVARKHLNLVIAPNTEELAADLDQMFKLKDAVAYLPNVYHPTRHPRVDPKVVKEEGTLDVGCFGAIRPLKNTLIQAVAAMKYADRENLRLRFHINGDRIEQRGEPIYHNIHGLFSGQGQHELVCHSWMPHKDFISLVEEMDLGMQVSYSETFCIVAADFIANDIPFVGSSEIPFIPSGLQADPNSSENICKLIGRSLGWYGFILRSLAKSNLAVWNRKAEAIWEKYIWESL